MKGPDLYESAGQIVADAIARGAIQRPIAMPATPARPPKKKKAAKRFNRRRDREPREPGPTTAALQAASDARNAESMRKCRERAALDPVSDMAQNHAARALMETPAITMQAPFLSDTHIKFMDRMVIYRLLNMAHGFAPDGLNEDGATILRDAHPFIPTTDEERRELWTLTSAPPPRTALFWRWAKALDAHLDRAVKREVAAAKAA